MKNSLIIKFDAPLRPEDKITETYGCRHTNPDICGSNSLRNICAFARSDSICKKPSRSWRKQFESLRAEEPL
jgi:hypothetical protein